MIYIQLLFACSSSESIKNMDSSNPIDLDSGVAANTELDDNQEYFGTKPSSQLTVPNFSAENYNEELRDKNNLIGQPTVIWFFPAAGTYG
tara:strand:- start:48 stop:317 length:270 start_codon:yes stop_codon:yes gene_type:complete